MSQASPTAVWEAVRWRQVQCDAQLNSGADAKDSVNDVEDIADGKNRIVDLKWSPRDIGGSSVVVVEKQQFHAPSIANFGGGSRDSDVKRIERPYISTQSFSQPQQHHHYAEHTLVSPHTPSTEQWRGHSNHIRASPRGRELYHNTDTAGRSPYQHRGKDDNPTHTSISLPSIASFSRDQTQNRGGTYATAFANNSGFKKERTSSCYCPQLEPLIQQAADAAKLLSLALQRHAIHVGEQQLVSSAATPVETLQRLISHLFAAETELRVISHPIPPICVRCQSTEHIPHQLKRHAELGERLREQDSKRSRTEAYNARPSPGLYDRGVSVSPRAESSQTWPRSDAGPQRLLPSPSSLVQPAHSYAQARTRVSASPPASTSYHASTSLHNVSTSSAASQHIANLEHQITLKSLSHQSLLTEHTNLMQKMQRQHVKTQTIERKCHAADIEINELAAKNDELNEQVKHLESQFADMERKRDEAVQSAGAEKEQWKRILDMSNRLQHKASEDCRRLQQEVNCLTEHISSSEETSQKHPERASPDINNASKEAQDQELITTKSSATIASLQLQIDTLRLALEEARQQSMSIDTDFAKLSDERKCLTLILNHALAQPKTVEAVSSASIDRQVQQTSQVSSIPPGSIQHRSDSDLEGSGTSEIQLDAAAASGAAQNPPKHTDDQTVELEDVGRTIKSSSVEAFFAANEKNTSAHVDLGIDVPTTTSSPEEIFRALGPVPIPVNQQP